MCYVSCVRPSHESSFTSTQQSHTETKHIIKFYKFNKEQNQSKYKCLTPRRRTLTKKQYNNQQRRILLEAVKCRVKITAGCDGGR